jgi:Tol biopolymer transport system component
MILNTSIRPNNLDIYLFETSGSAPRRLTDDPALDYNPVFSPDGQWVVFCSERRGNPDLYALDLMHEGPLRLLTDSPAMEDAPAFSPDGRRLAFVSTRDGRADIFVMPFRPDGPDASAQAVNLTQHHRHARPSASLSDGMDHDYERTAAPAGGSFNPAWSPDGRKIAFASDREGSPKGPIGVTTEIYVMDADGAHLMRLTDAEGWDGSPTWSADGRHILFYSDRAGGWRIWRMNADGSDPHPLSPENQRAFSPAIMADGRVAYSAGNWGKSRIMSVAADGSDPRPESDTQQFYWAPAFDSRSGRMVCHGTGPIESGSAIGGTFPENYTGPWRIAGAQSPVRLPDRAVERIVCRGFWSSQHPQGRTVASVDFLVNEQSTRLVTFRPDGAEVRELFRSKVARVEDFILQKRQYQRIWGPTWSPDGRWIAFAYGEPFGKPGDPCDIWKVQSDGTGAVNLTGDAKANDAFPSFSGDGRQIAFRSGRDGNEDIYLMQADGSSVRRITDHPAIDTMPTFAPQGDQIVFSSTRDGDYELYAVPLTADGRPGPVRRLTQSPGHDVHPCFSPDGQWLVFVSARGGLNDEHPLFGTMHPFPAQPYGELYALRLADGHVVRLTHDKWNDGLPTWSQVQD